MDLNVIYNEWLSSNEISQKDKNYLSQLSKKEIEDSFYKDIEFGTAGMRGIIAPGTNRMNSIMVKRATKGVSDYINSLGHTYAQKGVVISYDTRNKSCEFACLAAKVLAKNGIKVYLFENVRPVPICSFAILNLGCSAGIMITASHNPKEYNGYKLYGPDGAQMSPDATEKVVDYISSTPYFGIEEVDTIVNEDTIRNGDNLQLDNYICVIGNTIDNKYFDSIEKLSLSPEAVKKVGQTLKIVYTPIHGSGYMPVTTILKRMGIPFNVVPEQAIPDPCFSTVKVPNPEEPDALALGIKLANKISSDLVIGTDPDSDRIGVAIRNDKNEFILLNGNQIGVLIANYILEKKKENNVLPTNGAIVKTIVTTDMVTAIAKDYGVTVFDVLTGFKYIGNKIAEWETSKEYTYLYGFEESYGSLVGTHARDKDAVVASMMIAEMACYYASKNTSIYRVLNSLFEKYGYYVEKTSSVSFAGIDGMNKMKEIMTKAFSGTYQHIASYPVSSVCNLKTSIETLSDGSTVTIDLPKTSALKIKMVNGDWVCIRPSGTEPKIKIYVAAKGKSADEANEKINAYSNFMKDFLK